MVALDELEQAMDAATREVTLAPQSHQAMEASTSMVHLLSGILDALESGVVQQLKQEHRAELAEKFKTVTEHLENMRTMAERMERLGVFVPWRRELSAAIDRLGRVLMETGLSVSPEAPPPLLESAPGIAAKIRGLLARVDPDHVRATDPLSQAVIADVLDQQYEFLRSFVPSLVRIGHGYDPWFDDLADAVDALRARRDEIARTLERPVPSRVQRADVLDRYVAAAVRDARPHQLEDGSWVVELDGFPGVWADGQSPEAAVSALAEVLEDWAVLKLQLGDSDLPIVDTINLNLPAVSYPILSRR
jgi:predicted RNase H-like HicB family nuclease